MKKQILFIQGAGEGAYEEDKKLASSLRQLLGPQYEVRYPAMRKEDDADYETWVRQIEEELATLNDTVILAGHSVGGSVLIKFVTENEIKKTVAGVFLIAAPFWGGDNGWTYDGYETLALPQEADTKFPADVPLFFYHAKRDEVVPFAHLSLYSKRFPKAAARAIEGRNHQLNNDLTEVANDIKKLWDRV